MGTLTGIAVEYAVIQFVAGSPRVDGLKLALVETSWPASVILSYAVVAPIVSLQEHSKLQTFITREECGFTGGMCLAPNASFKTVKQVEQSSRDYSKAEQRDKIAAEEIADTEE